ncbi:Protein CBG16071 [Caenorhabditis briggsae]|uniref:Protein CBG16071 n=1 Tax=Caenorhabditis briggsae TaxID=6238 RepID=A8XN60_CAEBR|nr:Protein CBG16071 [Caenorhabditis briggsae]CAP34290.1 Protein CBG16071 [Caenorhabditis briggsae]
MQKYDGRVKRKLVPHNSAIRNGSVREWAWELFLDLQLHPYPVRSRTPYPVRLRMLKKRIRSRTQIRETARNGPVTDRKPSGHRNGSVRIFTCVESVQVYETFDNSFPTGPHTATTRNTHYLLAISSMMAIF